jgi:hypothetical protein
MSSGTTSLITPGGTSGMLSGHSSGPFGYSQKITVLKLQHANADGLSVVLGKVFPAVGITAEPRTNQLIVRASTEQLAEVEKLINELDVKTSSK